MENDSSNKAQLYKDELEKNKFRLEIIKAISAVLVPLSIFVLTYTLNENANESKKALEYQSTMFHEKKKIYDLIGPILNDFYCYHLYVGHWKELSPKELIAKKRMADKIIYVNKPFLSDSLLESYNKFIDTIYKKYTRVGEDAKLKTDANYHHTYYSGRDKSVWDVEKWDRYFIDSEEAIDATKADRQEVSKTYYAFLTLVAKEISPGHPRRNFKKDVKKDSTNINKTEQ